MRVLEVIASVLLVLGTAVLAVAVVGLFRLPDVYARSMALTLGSSVAMPLFVVAAWCAQPSAWDAVKVLVVLVLLPYTASVGSSVLVRAAYIRGAPMDAVFDDLDRHG